MSVALISYTKPSPALIVQGIEDMTDLVAFCARVSNPANQFNTDTAEKLIRYLINNKHWSPLEMINVCLEINTTRDIARQMLRHRSFAFQEFSQRYADPTKELDFVLREARLQDTKNRQQSVVTDDAVLCTEWDAKQKEVIEKAKEAYTWAIQHGIAKEQARCVLPEGNTVTRLYMNGSMRSWIHFIELRCGNGTQKEHAEVALECAKIIADLFPIIL
jgi:thymidylate synthase (FAD)